ncbi:hypothetical protein BDV25DRAFT_142366 [Aspergillus avenaceus]|uniref:BRCT domain-containing protein n=1 Tax=Aspergillus avenaceus TaxID=36643 RepID=A0A5N6TNC0_ASPAV|nr:hypothetical protein BDV25DRAFT_142366 [Aspergillus avenaceus]
MGNSFEKIHLCSIGSHNGNGDKIPQWVKSQGGKYSRTVTPQVTHLIVTKEAYRKSISAVKEAKRLGTVKIVTYDWLEDSLLSKSKMPKRENAYLLENIGKEERKKVKGRTGKVAKSVRRPGKRCTVTGKGSSSAGSRGKKSTAVQVPVGHHIYTDLTTRLTYSAMLIYETDNKPHTYSTECRYSRIGKQNTQQLAPTGSSLEAAMIAFNDFFEEQTATKWEQRHDGTLPPPKRDNEGNLLPPHEGWYIYEAPKGMFASYFQECPTVVHGAASEDQKHGVSDGSEQKLDGSQHNLDQVTKLEAKETAEDCDRALVENVHADLGFDDGVVNSG